MRIDPRQYTFDANDRRILQLALKDYIKDMERRSKRVKTEGISSAYQSDAARAEDILVTILTEGETT